MKHQNWKRLLAFAASAAMVLTMPGVQRLIGEYGSGASAAEIIVDDASSDDYVPDESTQVLDTITLSGGDDFAIEGLEEVDNPYLADNSSAGISQEQVTADSSRPMAVEAYITEEEWDAASADGSKAQGRAQWTRVYVNDYENDATGQAKIRINLTKGEDDEPATEVSAWLFDEYKETLPEKILLPPVTLEDALNGNEDLTVDRVQEYLLDEYGEYKKDNNGDYIVTADYLEFTLPAGSYAEFWLALMYYTNDESYEYNLSAEITATQVINGIEESILYEDYEDEDNDNKAEVTWKPQPESIEAAEPVEVPELVGSADELDQAEAPDANAAEDQAVEPATTEEIPETAVEAGGESELGTVIESETAAESETVTESETETEVVTESESETGTEVSTESETEAITEPGTESEPEAEISEETESESEMMTELESESEMMTELESESESERESEAETEDVRSKLPADLPISNIRVTMTKELEETEAPETEAGAEILPEDGIESSESEDADAAEETSKGTAENDTAVSGQTYVVHVHAEDTQQDAEYDSTVRICLTDLTTGLPAGDVATTVASAKEGLDMAEPAAVSTLYGAAQTAEGTADLTVTRVQETAAAEDGSQTVTADYLEFKLPAGGSADFYVGFTYETEADAYQKQMMIEVKAVQYIPVPEAESEAEDGTAGTETNAAEAPEQMAEMMQPDAGAEADVNSVEELLDETPAGTADADQELPSASEPVANEELGVKTQSADFEDTLAGLGSTNIPAESQTVIAENGGAGLAVEAVTLAADSSTDDNNTQVVAVDVLEAQTQEVTMLWASASQADEPSAQANDATRFTPEETKKLIAYLEAYPNYVLLDTTNSRNYSVDWNNGNPNKSNNLYCSIHVGDSNWFAQTAKNVEGIANIWAFDLGTGNDSADMDFGYSDVWGKVGTSTLGNNGTPLWKTETRKVSAWKGKLLQIAGTVTATGTDDNGVLHYTVAETIFDKSPLSGKVVYLDMTNIADMTAPPKVKITEADGTITYKEMTLCPEETSVYSYRFDSYVLPGTTFQFVSADESEASAIPSEAVTDFDKATPCYNGVEWVAYSPKISTAKIHVQHDFETGIAIVFTKGGNETGTVINTPADSTFDFNLYSEEYDGFYVRKYGDTTTGNRTVIAGREDVRAAALMHETTELNAWVGKYTGSQRQLSFTAYGADGDASLDIPLGTFNRNSDVLYVKSTFYDYYSDLELQGKNRKRYGTSDSSNGSNDKVQARNFNSAISAYFSGTGLASGTRPSPLYFGEFTQAGTSGLTNFVWANNNGEPNRVSGAAGARQGLVDTTLTNGQLTMGGVLAPYFNESFLRGGNSTGTNIGYVFPEVEFPFVKNSSGYWEFDSYQSSETLRMKRDPSGFYFLDQVGESNDVHGHTSSDITVNSNFFPFNDHTESGDWGKLNYAFGARLDIPFYMTENGTVDLGHGDEHIVFNFSGDDDVWIFIDGQLVLDIGGDHGAVTGNIDFNTRTATTTTNDTSANGCRGGSYTFGEELTDPSKEHTLTMFYMERGLWESNMKITFNFPQSNELEVEKEVVIPNGVNPLFSSVIKGINDVEFPISIENLATSYGHISVDQIQPAIEAAADLITAATSAKLDTPKTSAACSVGTYGGRTEVLKYYYPGKKNYSDGQSVTDARSIYIDTDLTFDTTSDQIKTKGYIQLDTYADSSVSATDPFVALVDDRGNRIGGWISGSAYDSTSKSMGSKVWKTLRIVIDKLQPIQGSNFNYLHITGIQFSYHDSINIYIDNIYIKAAPQYVQSTGFTKDDDKIPDYNSRIEPYALQPINGAEYVDRQGESSQVTDGRVYLKDDGLVRFSDQFRRNSYLRLEEAVDSNIFDTSWLLYLDGEKIASGSGTVPGDGRTATNESGTDVTNPGKPAESILFMSKNRNMTDYFVETVKYVNTLKLGDIAVTKELVDGQTPDENKEYTFNVYFANVAGMMLEGQDNYIPYTFKLKPGETEVIKGIPLGTQYIITEKTTDDDGSSYCTLTNITHTEGGDDGADINLDEHQVTGVVSGTVQDTYTFTNDQRPSMDIDGEKTWDSSIGESEMPTEVELKLVAAYSDNSSYAARDYLDYLFGAKDENELRYSIDDYEKHVTVLDPAKDMSGNSVQPKRVSDATDWKYSFKNLPQQTDSDIVDNNGDPCYYKYMVVETRVYGGIYGEEGMPIEDTQFGWSFNMDYDSVNKTTSYNVNNVRQDDITVKIIKGDEKNFVKEEYRKISDVKFELYRQYLSTDVRLNDIGEDDQFTAAELGSTGTNVPPANNGAGSDYVYVKLGEKVTDREGEISFTDMKKGTYYLKETVPAGYEAPDSPWTMFKVDPGLGSRQHVEINGIPQEGTPIPEGFSWGFFTYSDTYWWHGDGWVWDPSENTMYLPIHNQMKRTVLEITKVDAKNTDTKLSDITFELIKQFVPEVERDENGNAKTDAAGNPIYLKGENGNYIYPYEASKDTYYLRYKELDEKEVESDGLPASFESKELGEDGQTKTIQVPYKYVRVEYQVTDENGWAAFTGLVSEHMDPETYENSYTYDGYGNGTYYLVEKGIEQSDSYLAPDGYNMLDGPIKVVISRDGTPEFSVDGSGVNGTPVLSGETTYTYTDDEGTEYSFTGYKLSMTLENSPGPGLEITKTDQSDASTKLAGAKFSLYRRYTPVEQNGTDSLDNTELKYKVKTEYLGRIEYPYNRGWGIGWKPRFYDEEIVYNEEGNRIYTGKETGTYIYEYEGLSTGIDALIPQYDSNLPANTDVPYGYVKIGEATTAKDSGIASFADKKLPDGTYILVETEAPAGYEKLKEVITLEVNHNVAQWCTTSSNYVTVNNPDSDKNVCQITVKNPKKMTLEVQKLDAQNSALLGGAEFTLYKQGDAPDEGDTTEPPVPGMAEGYSYDKVAEKTTGSAGTNTGIATFDDLDNGTYYLWESKAPQGYTRVMTEALKIEINRDDATEPVKIGGAAVAAPGEANTTAYSLNGSKITVKIDNTPIKTKLQLTKVSSEDADTKLGGVTFEIYGQYTSEEEAKKVNGTDAAISSPSDENGLPKKVTVSTGNGTEEKDAVYVNIQEITTAASGDKLGIAESNGLANGTYILKEKSTAEGYVLSKELITVVIDRTATPAVSTVTGTDVVPAAGGTGNCELDAANNLLKFTVKNTPKKTNLKLVKQDEETKAGLNGVVFNLYKPYTEPSEGDPTPTRTALESGLGSKDEGKLYGLVKADGTIATTLNDGELLTASDSGSEGIINISNLSNGTYYLVENTTIDGYKPLDSVITIHIDRTNSDESRQITVTGTGVNTDGLTDGKYTLVDDTVTITVDNVPLAKVQITKVDSTSQSVKLQGAEFDLYREVAAGADGVITELPTGENGTFSKVGSTLITDGNGIATTGYLEPGTYYLIETKAPAGTDGTPYNKLTSAIKFTVAYTDKKSSVTVISGSGAAAGALTETAAGTHIFAVTISDPPYTSLKIKKTGTDADGNNVEDMSGVKFDFYRQYASKKAASADGVAEANILEADNASLADTKFPTTPAGVVYVKLQQDLTTAGTDNIAEIPGRQPDGTYYLVETEAKDGFQKLENPIKITVSHDAELKTTVTADSADVELVDGIYQITVVNSKNDLTNLKIKKVDAENSSSPLDGVEFELYRQFNGGNEEDGFVTAPYSGMADTYTTDGDGTGQYKYKLVSGVADGHTTWITAAESNADGLEAGCTPAIENLEDGVYYIVETKAKSGYSLLANPIKVTINRSNSEHPVTAEYGDENPYYPTIDGDNTVTITIQNRAKFIFPETGGYGSTIMVLGGLALAGAALFMYILQIRKKRRCAP